MMRSCSMHPDGTGVRLKLLTNWQLDRGDPLARMINNRSGSMRLERLYGSKTDKSKEGAVRKRWREHLGIDEDELRLLARTLAFGHVSETLDDLRERLDEVFGVVGLRRVPPNQSTVIYDDLVFQWMAQGRLEFRSQHISGSMRARRIAQPIHRPPARLWREVF